MARRRPTPFLTEARGPGWRMKVGIEGSADLKAVLRAVDRETSGTALLVAVDKGGQVLEGAMSSLAPRSARGSRGHQPGFLADNIGREVQRLTGRKAQVAVAPKKEAFYGMFQEIGTSDMAPQPFMRPALDATVDAIVDAVAVELRRVVEAICLGD